MNHLAKASFVLALSSLAAGCGAPSPESVCSKLKDLGSMPANCEATWTAKKTANAATYKTQAACVMDAKSGSEGADCSQK